MNEAGTCRKYVVPKLQAAAWENDPHSLTEQKSFTDGRIVVVGNKARRQAQKRADYLLRYTRDFPIAVVEAKAAYRSPGGGLQQAKDYATVLGLKFAYATNGHGIVEFDFLTGLETDKLLAFPVPVPSRDEQTAIVAYLKKLRDTLAAASVRADAAGKELKVLARVALSRAFAPAFERGPSSAPALAS